MVLLIILAFSEFLTFYLFRQHYKGYSKTKYYLSNIVSAILSLYMWILYIEVHSFSGPADSPAFVWLSTNLNGTYCAVLFPRILLIILHFTGRIINYYKGTSFRWFTNAGIILWIILLSAVLSGTLRGRFKTTTENVTIKIEGLHEDLEGFTIVQVSDLHLSGFHRHAGYLQDVIKGIESYKPDLIVNTGDFVNYSWREFEQNDTILVKAKGKYGQYAILGNHDIGTYMKSSGSSDIDTNVARMTRLISLSGYNVLNDNNQIIKVGNAKLGLAGVITKGRHSHIIHGNLEKALEGLDSADFKLLLSHDPNHWDLSVKNKTDVDLTLSGHTHGMQMGIITKKVKWSPSRYYYQEWNGLYTDGDQYLYVNRGLGVLGIPFRIGMPPEITVIKLTGE